MDYGILEKMRDKSHGDFIERWAEFVRTHPNEWKAIHTQFIDAQYEKAFRVINELKKTKEGRAKLVELYGIKNRIGFSEFFD